MTPVRFHRPQSIGKLEFEALVRSAALAKGVSVGALDWTGDLILLVLVEGSRQDIESFQRGWPI